MKVIKRNSNKNQHFVLAIALIFAIVSIFIGILCFQYYTQVRDTVKSESESYMLEISKQMGNNVSRSINDNFSALKTIAVSLEYSEENTIEVLNKKVNELRKHWKYDKVLIIDQNANSYDDQGNPVRLNNDAYLQNVISNKQAAMSASEVINGVECIVFAIPVSFSIEINVYGMPKQIINAKALAATYDYDTYDQILSINAFDSKGYGHIVRSNGTVVIRSSNPNQFEAGYNILNTIERHMDSSNASELKKVREDLKVGNNGFAQFKMNSGAVYMSYIPIDIQIDGEDWRLLTFVPIEEVSAKSELLLRLTLVLCGCITATFMVLCAIILFVTFKNRRKLEYIAYVDEITKGSSIRLFNENAANVLLSAEKDEFAILYTNIEKFKVLNEQFGRDGCDNLLLSISGGISKNLQDDECMGRLFADNFCILVRYNGAAELLERIKIWKRNCNETYSNNNIARMPFTIEFGVFVICDPKIALSQLIDRAKLSLSVGNPLIFENIKLSIYNEELRKRMLREKQLEDMMEEAIENCEFEVYLQPKYHTSSEEIGGAEALVRWNSASEGMIYPNEFISLFEKNGFIVRLDLYVFKSVCKTVRKWIDAGLEPIKISVNCSRMHLKNVDFLKSYIQYANQYNIPRKIIEIEFTENIVFSEIDYFSEVIHEIHKAGFGCSMDDFGSGYSSLSLIQDIPVDTIKLDRVFFRKRNQESDGRMESIVKSVIQMSKALKMTTVAEGVEEKEQVAMLKRLNCDLIQGFYFAKPMPIPEFEKLAFGRIVSKEGDSK